MHVQLVFLLIRSIGLEAIFIVVPRLALHDLIFLFTRIINQSFALALAKSIYYFSEMGRFGSAKTLLNILEPNPFFP